MTPEDRRPDIESTLYKDWVKFSSDWMANHDMRVSTKVVEENPDILVEYINPHTGVVSPLLNMNRGKKDVLINKSFFTDLTSGVQGVEVHPFARVGILQKKRRMVTEVMINEQLLYNLGREEIAWAYAFAQTECKAIVSGNYSGLKVEFLETYYSLLKDDNLEI